MTTSQPPLTAAAVAAMRREVQVALDGPSGLDDPGRFDLIVNGDSIPVSNIERLEDLPWARHQVDLVMECTGTFTSRERSTPS